MVVSRADSNISTRAGGTFKSSGIITCPRLKFLLVSYIENHLISKIVRFPGSFNRTSCRPTLEFGLNSFILFHIIIIVIAIDYEFMCAVIDITCLPYAFNGSR